MTDLLRNVIDVLTRERLPSTPELLLQDRIAQCLTSVGITFEREVRLTPQDRIDFVIASVVGLEVKIEGPLAQVTRQLHRYAQSAQLASIILVTTRMRHRMVERVMNGKPVDVVHLIGSAF